MSCFDSRPMISRRGAECDKLPASYFIASVVIIGCQVSDPRRTVVTGPAQIHVRPGGLFFYPNPVWHPFLQALRRSKLAGAMAGIKYSEISMFHEAGNQP